MALALVGLMSYIILEASGLAYGLVVEFSAHVVSGLQDKAYLGRADEILRGPRTGSGVHGSRDGRSRGPGETEFAAGDMSAAETVRSRMPRAM